MSMSGSTGKEGHYEVKYDARTVNNSSDSYEKSDNISTNTTNPSIDKDSKQPSSSQEPSELSEPSSSSKPLSNDYIVKPLKEGKKISAESASSPIDKKFKCFYCEDTFQDDLERIKHIDVEHASRLHHPTQEDFENRMER
jgi:hypothetical protein